MGRSIVLDPWIFYNLTRQICIAGLKSLSPVPWSSMVIGIILPNLKMSGPGSCAFLNQGGALFDPSSGRDSARYSAGAAYEYRSFSYFLQVHECRKENRSKVKVRKWIMTRRMWELMRRILRIGTIFLIPEMLKASRDESLARQFNLYLLNCFL